MKDWRKKFVEELRATWGNRRTEPEDKPVKRNKYLEDEITAMRNYWEKEELSADQRAEIERLIHNDID